MLSQSHSTKKQDTHPDVSTQSTDTLSTGLGYEIKHLGTEIVSHGTENIESIPSLLNEPQLQGRTYNLYGPQPSFYLAESGYAFEEIDANLIVVYRLSRDAKILYHREPSKTDSHKARDKPRFARGP